MKSVTVRFEWSGLSVNIYPATSENGAYAHELQKAAHPHQLALTLDKLTEATALRIMVEAYAKTVIIGSPDKELSHFENEDWAGWLIAHPDEFDFLRHIAENPQDWEKLADGG